MQAILYLVGGYIVFLGSYGYLKFKDSAGMRPSGVHEKWFEWNGVLGNLLSLPYLVAMMFLHEWWDPAPFLIGGGILTAFLFRTTGGLLPLFLSVFGTPIGIALVILSFFVKN